MTSIVYDPSKNIVRVGGHTLVGVTDIRILRGVETFRVVEGVHPLYSARIKNFRRPFKLMVKLLQTSASNSVLQYLSTSSEVTVNSFFRVEVLSQNADGNVVANLSSTGYVLTSPDLLLGNDTNDREWTFMVNAFDFSGLTDIIT